MIPSQMIHPFVSQLGGPYASQLAMYLFGGIMSLLQNNQMFSGGLALIVVAYLGNLLSASIVSAFLRALVERIIDAMRGKIAHKTHIYTVARGNVWVHAALSSPTSRNSDLPARGTKITGSLIAGVSCCLEHPEPANPLSALLCQAMSVGMSAYCLSIRLA